MKKKILSYILTLVMTVTILGVPGTVFGADAENEDATVNNEIIEQPGEGTEVATPAVKVIDCAATVTAKPINYHTVKLSWTKVQGVDKYTVYISKDKKNWKKEATVAGTVCNITKLNTGKTRYFKVVSVLPKKLMSAASETEILSTSNIVEAKTYLNRTKANSKLKSVKKQTIKWNKVDGANGYLVYKYNNKTKKYNRVKKVSAKTLKTNVALTPGKTNSFKVKAYRYSEGTMVTASDSNIVKRYVPRALKRSTPGFKDTNANAITRLASTKLGCSYVPGASGPYAFDCSGFAYWVIKNAHVSRSFTRSSAQGEYSQLRQYNIGRNIKNAQPGDLIFYSSGGSTRNIHHVAIYYGNGKIIHASTSSTGVIKTSYRYSGTVAAIVRLPGV